MRVQWEQRGLLLPVYRLAARGWSDAQIAEKLDVVEPRIQDCMRGLLHFLNLTNRHQLSAHVSGPQVGTLIPGTPTVFS